jgi:hypothetical protein
MGLFAHSSKKNAYFCTPCAFLNQAFNKLSIIIHYMNLFTTLSAGATRLLICVFILLPTLSKAQWSLNLGGSGEISHLNQLNAIIDYHNHLNASALIAPLPHFGLFTGRSIEIGKDWKHLQLGGHYNRLTQTVKNNSALAPNAIELLYYNAQIGIRAEWMFCAYFGMGGTLDCNLLNVSRSNPIKQNGYYTNSANLFAEGYWSYRYQLHFQKLLNPYFAVSFRPYYQQSFNTLDFSGVHRSLGKTVTTLSSARDVPEFAAAPQRWITFGSELTLRMFLSHKGLN